VLRWLRKPAEFRPLIDWSRPSRATIITIATNINRTGSAFSANQ
jgi:hypothetical protein